MEPGLLFWFCKINDFGFHGNNFSFILNQLSPRETDSIQRFLFENDRKRAMASILLRHALVHEVFHPVNQDVYKIQRTKEVRLILSSK
jgi:phosphopantetheinyl transferase